MKNGFWRYVLTGVLCLLVGFSVTGLLWAGGQTEKVLQLQTVLAEHLKWAEKRNAELETISKNQEVLNSRLGNVVEELREIKDELRKQRR